MSHQIKTFTQNGLNQNKNIYALKEETKSGQPEISIQKPSTLNFETDF